MSSELLAFVALAVTGTATLLWFRAMQRVAIPHDRSRFVAAWVGGALLGALALWSGDGALTAIPAGLALFMGTMFTMLFAISRQVAAPDVISVGDRLPTFVALDEHGDRIDQTALAGHPTLIKFFRGHW